MLKIKNSYEIDLPYPINTHILKVNSLCKIVQRWGIRRGRKALTNALSHLCLPNLQGLLTGGRCSSEWSRSLRVCAWRVTLFLVPSSSLTQEASFCPALPGVACWLFAGLQTVVWAWTETSGICSRHVSCDSKLTKNDLEYNTDFLQVSQGKKKKITKKMKGKYWRETE